MEDSLKPPNNFGGSRTLLPASVAFPSLWTILWTSLGFFFVYNWKRVCIVGQTFGRDFKGISRYICAARKVRKLQQTGETAADLFDITVQKHPTKVCYYYEGRQWTFKEVWELSNQVGNYFQTQGFRKGDVAALLMTNRPEYVCIWLGLSKIGVVTYLINTNLRQKLLKHSFDIANPKAVIYGQELSQAIAEVFEEELETGNHIPLFSVDGCLSLVKTNVNSHVENITPALATLERSSTNLKQKLEEVNALKTNPEVEEGQKSTFSDILICIYTSGTTGLPKAAIVKHSRFVGAAISAYNLNGIESDDVFYCCLPLYHTAAEFFGAGIAILFGNSVVIKSKFSASSFWKDCVEHNVTVALHIGELCRYLLSQKFTMEETQHQVRLMVGNGLRPEIWKKFVTRFRIPRITEFYASTEGNCNMLNFDSRVGAVGFVPILLYTKYPVGVFKVDQVTGELLRNPRTGQAIRCQPNEPGELLGKIVATNPYREFRGYANDEMATKKKIAENVFSMGDTAFRTGDYLVMDEYGYFYFKDRAGDTFRWKGENVSTAEVESVISNICGLKDCVVYGVGIPGTDGKAGMAAIADPKNSLDLKVLSEGIKPALPSYARPLFLRVSKQLETTGTHKLKKVELQSEGFNVERIQEPIYFYTNENYIPLDAETYTKIVSGKIRV